MESFRSSLVTAGVISALILSATWPGHVVAGLTKTITRPFPGQNAACSFPDDSQGGPEAFTFIAEASTASLTLAAPYRSADDLPAFFGLGFIAVVRRDAFDARHVLYQGSSFFSCDTSTISRGQQFAGPMDPETLPFFDDFQTPAPGWQLSSACFTATNPSCTAPSGGATLVLNSLDITQVPTASISIDSLIPGVRYVVHGSMQADISPDNQTFLRRLSISVDFPPDTVPPPAPVRTVLIPAAAFIRTQGATASIDQGRLGGSGAFTSRIDLPGGAEITDLSLVAKTVQGSAPVIARLYRVSRFTFTGDGTRPPEEIAAVSSNPGSSGVGSFSSAVSSLCSAPPGQRPSAGCIDHSSWYYYLKLALPPASGALVYGVRVSLRQPTPPDGWTSIGTSAVGFESVLPASFAGDPDAGNLPAGFTSREFIAPIQISDGSCVDALRLVADDTVVFDGDGTAQRVKAELVDVAISGGSVIADAETDRAGDDFCGQTPCPSSHECFPACVPGQFSTSFSSAECPNAGRTIDSDGYQFLRLTLPLRSTPDDPEVRAHGVVVHTMDPAAPASRVTLAARPFVPDSGSGAARTASDLALSGVGDFYAALAVPRGARLTKLRMDARDDDLSGLAVARIYRLDTDPSSADSPLTEIAHVDSSVPDPPGRTGPRAGASGQPPASGHTQAPGPLGASPRIGSAPDPIAGGGEHAHGGLRGPKAASPRSNGEIAPTHGLPGNFRRFSTTAVAPDPVDPCRYFYLAKFELGSSESPAMGMAIDYSLPPPGPNDGGGCGCDGVVCLPLDACHLAGVCDPATGLCSNPAAPDGAVCDDESSCTANDACSAGLCAGQPGVTSLPFLDTFMGPGLDPCWTFVDPVGDATYDVTAGHLVLRSPAGTSHDCWDLGPNCTRAVRSVPDVDAVYETKIDGGDLSAANQDYGIILLQDACNHIRFEYWTAGAGVYVRAYRVIGCASEANPAISTALPVSLGAASSLRVTRIGDLFTLEYRIDAGPWTTAGYLTQPDFAVRQAGPFTNNAVGNPATIAAADYFSVESLGADHDIRILSGPAGAPSPSASGEIVQLDVTAADTQGHGLGYHWEAMCPDLGSNGAFTPGQDSRNPQWTAPVNATGEIRVCTLTLVIDDGGGGLSRTASYAQRVDSAAHTVEIRELAGNPNPVAPGGTAQFTAVVTDSFGHDLAFAWTGSCAGGLGGGQFSAPSSSVTSWTAPSNATAAPVECTITIIVTDGAFEFLATSRSFIETIQGLNPGDTAPPARSSGQPAGTLPSGSGTATLSLVTDENAVCRYATEPGTPYGAMISQFTTTGTMLHTTPVPVSDGTVNTFYVRCEDAAGNANTGDFAITFSVAGSASGFPFLDEFTGALAPGWNLIDPADDSQLAVISGHMEIAVPAGSSHDCWTAGLNCARASRAMPDTNAVFETKIDGSGLGAANQDYGILLLQDPSNFMKFEFWSGGAGVYVRAYRVRSGHGFLPPAISTPAPVTLGASNTLRVTVAHGMFTLQYRIDGGALTTVGTFVESGFALREAGIFVNNAIGNPLTAGNFDYFSASRPPSPFKSTHGGEMEQPSPAVP